ncbi:MAG: zinc ribbon domain-containing protein [Verrucomicrobiota bacterium]|nr:zinc ribbon domain-containing protein [Verrucomicrobiota bacterium]
MLICPKCGNQNPLGRVFCVTCGSKLDLSRMSSEVVKESEKQNWFLFHWPKLLYGLLGLFLILAAMALWPNTQALGERGADLKGQQLERQLELARMSLRPGRRMSLPMMEKDINSYLGLKARKWGITGVSADIAADYFTIHVVQTVASVSIPGTERVLEPKYSYTLVCVPSGNAVRVSKATFGRLTMVGPLRNAIVAKFAGLLAREKEWELSRAVQDIKAEKDKLTLILGK